MPDASLDDPAVYERIDPDRLRDRIDGLPAQFEEAWAAANALDLPPHYGDVERVVVLGMGGSGIGGLLLRGLAVEIGANAPVSVVRGYRLPASVNARTLVIASSNSGNTEEIVSAFSQALATGARCIVVAAGGRLLDMAREARIPALRVRWDAEPRAALGWSYASLVAICTRLGLLEDMGRQFAAAVSDMRSRRETLSPAAPDASNPAKQLARRWHGKLPVIIGAEALAPVAYRWRTQVNENAKSWAIADELPEMNHNAPLGYGAPPALVPLLHVVLLRHASMHPRIRLRVEATCDDLAANGVTAEIVDVPGDGVLSQQLQAAQLGDWASYYLGVLNGVNPSSVDALDRLKQLLASKE